jgi:hypothetical protein
MFGAILAGHAHVAVHHWMMSSFKLFAALLKSTKLQISFWNHIQQPSPDPWIRA